MPLPIARLAGGILAEDANFEMLASRDAAVRIVAVGRVVGVGCRIVHGGLRGV